MARHFTGVISVVTGLVNCCLYFGAKSHTCYFSRSASDRCVLSCRSGGVPICY
jgi:hypothetical protein